MITAQGYVELRRREKIFKVPLEGRIDLTYRCNNHCRHCWISIPAQAKEAKEEISFKEIKSIAESAKRMGCQVWYISGGEPMLRPDFSEIFDYLSNNFLGYVINTNGTLISPKIAKLMKGRGLNVVALCGATSRVHDRITRHPGSFAATLRGFRYLKEAGANFIVQLIPMKDNYHQLKAMLKLARSLSKCWRIGANWLYLSYDRNQERNQEIMRQRLSPKEIIGLNRFGLFLRDKRSQELKYLGQKEEKYLFNHCINARREFHIDAYGKMSFCGFINEPGLRYDLRKGNFKEAWDKFIPSLAKKIKVNTEYKENCGACNLRPRCWVCPAYSYLEHSRFSAKIDYLCLVTKALAQTSEGVGG